MNEVINITPTEPKLSTSNVGDVGTIKLNNLPPLDTTNTPKKSVNFGPGIEMLMNDKRRSSSPKSDIKLSDLESLDTNINLNDSNKSSNTSRKEATAAMFGAVPLNNSGPPNITLNVTEKTNGPSVNTAGPALGAATAQNPNNEKTWDGFKKFNEIPVDPTKQIPKTPQLSNDQILREKLKILRKLFQMMFL